MGNKENLDSKTCFGGEIGEVGEVNVASEPVLVGLPRVTVPDLVIMGDGKSILGSAAPLFPTCNVAPRRGPFTLSCDDICVGG